MNLNEILEFIKKQAEIIVENLTKVFGSENFMEKIGINPKAYYNKFVEIIANFYRAHYDSTINLIKIFKRGQNEFSFVDIETIDTIRIFVLLFIFIFALLCGSTSSKFKNKVFMQGPMMLFYAYITFVGHINLNDSKYVINFLTSCTEDEKLPDWLSIFDEHYNLDIITCCLFVALILLQFYRVLKHLPGFFIFMILWSEYLHKHENKLLLFILFAISYLFGYILLISLSYIFSPIIYAFFSSLILLNTCFILGGEELIKIYPVDVLITNMLYLDSHVFNTQLFYMFCFIFILSFFNQFLINKESRETYKISSGQIQCVTVYKN